VYAQRSGVIAHLRNNYEKKSDSEIKTSFGKTMNNAVEEVVWYLGTPTETIYFFSLRRGLLRLPLGSRSIALFHREKSVPHNLQLQGRVRHL